jgi:hypothetical protein
MDFKPSADIQAQFESHESAVSHVANSNVTVLEKQLAREANLERNGFPRLHGAFVKIHSGSKRTYPSGGKPGDIQLRQDERIVGAALFTPWVTISSIGPDQSGLQPNFRYINTEAVSGPLGSHTTRAIHEIQMRWVRDEFVSEYESVVSFSGNRQSLSLVDSGIRLDLGSELSDEQLSVYNEVMNSLITPFSEQFTS